MNNGTLLLLETQLATLLVGLRTKLPADGKYYVAGTAYTRDTLAEKVEEILGLFKSTREARAAVRLLAHERDLRMPELRILLKEIRSMLNTQFGMESPVLLGFGFEPRHRRAQPGAAAPEGEKPAA